MWKPWDLVKMQTLTGWVWSRAQNSSFLLLGDTHAAGLPSTRGSIVIMETQNWKGKIFQILWRRAWVEIPYRLWFTGQLTRDLLLRSNGSESLQRSSKHLVMTVEWDAWCLPFLPPWAFQIQILEMSSAKCQLTSGLSCLEFWKEPEF